MPSPSRPSWLTRPCPLWCAGEHYETDQAAERSHQGSSHHVPVVLLGRYSGEAGRVIRDITAAEFDVLRYRYLDGQHDWLFIGDSDHQLDLSLESAHRLHAALGAVLGSGG